MSGDTDSGFGVITVDTGVKAKGNSLATASDIDIMSLNLNMPTNRPFLTTSVAFRASAIICPVSWIVVGGETMVDGLPAKTVCVC